MTDEARLVVPRIGIWTGSLDSVPTSQARELAVELEELGFGMLWIPEVAGRDVFAHLALLLSSTQRLIGATGIATIWGRDAVTMAGGVKALTEAFPERFLLGLGVSHRNLVDELRGHHYDRPLSAMRAYLKAMDSAPYTAQRPSTPVRRVLAALGPKMLAMAAELVDGVHPYFVTPEHTATARRILGERPLLCPEQAVLVETDPERAREVGRAHTSVYLGQPNYVNNLLRMGFSEQDVEGGGSDRLVDSIVAWGTLDQIRDRVFAHLEAGADHVCVQPLGAARRTVPQRQWRELAPALVEAGATFAP